MQFRFARVALYTTLALGCLLVHAAPVEAKSKPKSSARAKAVKKTVALGVIEGRKTEQVRDWVSEALEGAFDVTDADGFKVKGDNGSYVKMASDLGVEAIVVGKLEKTKLVLTVRDGENGKALTSFDLAGSGAKLKTQIDKRVASKVARALGVQTPAEAAQRDEEEQEEQEEAKADEEPAEKESDNESDEDKSDGDDEKEDSDSDSDDDTSADYNPRTPLTVELGARIGTRAFKFNDALVGTAGPLRDYNGGTDFTPTVAVGFYPITLFSGSSFGADILGVVGRFEYKLPSTLKFRDTDLTAKSQTLEGGLRGRFCLGEYTELGANLGLGSHKYILDGDEKDAIVPDVSYTYLYWGLDFETQFSKVIVGLRANMRMVTDTGELQRSNLWFKNVGTTSVEAGLTLGYQLAPWLAVAGRGELLQYGFDFNPIPAGAPRIAGGATDRYVSGWLGFRFQVPGGD